MPTMHNFAKNTGTRKYSDMQFLTKELCQGHSHDSKIHFWWDGSLGFSLR